MKDKTNAKWCAIHWIGSAWKISIAVIFEKILFTSVHTLPKWTFQPDSCRSQRNWNLTRKHKQASTRNWNLTHKRIGFYLRPSLMVVLFLYKLEVDCDHWLLLKGLSTCRKHWNSKVASTHGSRVSGTSIITLCSWCFTMFVIARISTSALLAKLQACILVSWKK